MDELKKAMSNTLTIMANEKQAQILSKVCGRENYMIITQDNRVIYAGTKGKWVREWPHVLPLEIAAKRQYFYFTYKRDWLAALDVLKNNND